MRKRADEDAPTAPFPTTPVSNMEWCPLPITRKQRLVAKLIEEETTARAKRHGMTRAAFLRTAAATATAFMVLNKVYGIDQTGDAAAMPVKRQHCDDLDAARERLDTDEFIMDVQQHHVDLEKWGNVDLFCFLQFTDSPLVLEYFASIRNATVCTRVPSWTSAPSDV